PLRGARDVVRLRSQKRGEARAIARVPGLDQAVEDGFELGLQRRKDTAACCAVAIRAATVPAETPAALCRARPARPSGSASGGRGRERRRRAAAWLRRTPATDCA